MFFAIKEHRKYWIQIVNHYIGITYGMNMNLEATMRRVLILGKGGYIAEKLYGWLRKDSENYNVDIVSTLEDEWKRANYSDVDTVVNCVGIAHINNITEDMKPLFYSVNRDLAVSMATWAKERGVKHFVHFSSMNVYGDYCDCLVDREGTKPTSFYGDSKLQGDIGLGALATNDFVVAYLRPPFVYGKGCKGNYNSISRIARKTPIFPDYPNKKSMIYIDNLCEFVRMVIDSKQGGVLTPQNKELVSTADLVRCIAMVNQRKVVFTKLFNWLIPIANRMTRLVRRAFANDCYELSISDYYGFTYCVVSFEDSIRETEL